MTMIKDNLCKKWHMFLFVIVLVLVCGCHGSLGEISISDEGSRSDGESGPDEGSHPNSEIEDQAQSEIEDQAQDDPDEEEEDDGLDVASYADISTLPRYGNSSMWKYSETDGISDEYDEFYVISSDLLVDGELLGYMLDKQDEIGDSYEQEYYLRDTSEALYLVGGRDEDDNEYSYDPPVPVLLKDFSPGIEYVYESIRIDGVDTKNVEWRLQLDPVNIVGPTGNYDDCYRAEIVMKIGDEIITDVRWYAKHVGLVRRVVIGVDREYTWDLAYQVYEEDFDDGPSGWCVYVAGDHDDALVRYPTSSLIEMPWGEEDGNGYVESYPPWWLDPNHRPPGGYGYLMLLGWTQMKLWNLCVGMESYTIDLTNGLLEFNMYVDDLDLKGANVVFWFQTNVDFDAPYGKYVNFALTAYPIESFVVEGAWTNVALPLDPSEDDWTCMGAAAGTRYGCAPIDEAMRDVNTNFGFIIIPIADPNDLPSATVRISNFKISHRR